MERRQPPYQQRQTSTPRFGNFSCRRNSISQISAIFQRRRQRALSFDDILVSWKITFVRPVSPCDPLTVFGPEVRSG